MVSHPHAGAVWRIGVAFAGLVVLASCDLSLAQGSPAPDPDRPDEPDRPDRPDRIDQRVMEAYLQCLDTCTAGIGADHATCRLACASSSLDDVPDLSAGAKVCMLPCLETLARCAIGCDAAPTPPDDEHACQLRCESSASSCLSHCVDENE